MQAYCFEIFGGGQMPQMPPPPCCAPSLAYQHVSRLLATLVVMLIPLQLLSGHHNPSCDGVSTCAHDAEEKKDN